jgi:uncharacterized membrane protein YbaN (DUF454 family)
MNTQSGNFVPVLMRVTYPSHRSTFARGSIIVWERLLSHDDYFPDYGLGHNAVHHFLKDPAILRRVKLRAVIVLALIFAYIISPIEFIPIAGWLSDLVVVPLGLALVRKITPGFDVVEKRGRVQANVRRIIFWAILSVLVAILLVLVWLGLLIYIIVRLITH